MSPQARITSYREAEEVAQEYPSPTRIMQQPHRLINLSAVPGITIAMRNCKCSDDSVTLLKAAGPNVLYDFDGCENQGRARLILESISAGANSDSLLSPSLATEGSCVASNDEQTVEHEDLSE